jgi:hypothetical protein
MYGLLVVLTRDHDQRRECSHVLYHYILGLRCPATKTGCQVLVLGGDADNDHQDTTDKLCDIDSRRDLSFGAPSETCGS